MRKKGWKRMKRKESKRKPKRSCKQEEVLERDRSASMSSMRSIAEFAKRKRREKRWEQKKGKIF